MTARPAGQSLASVCFRYAALFVVSTAITAAWASAVGWVHPLSLSTWRVVADPAVGVLVVVGVALGLVGRGRSRARWADAPRPSGDARPPWSNRRLSAVHLIAGIVFLAVMGLIGIDLHDRFTGVSLGVFNTLIPISGGIAVLIADRLSGWQVRYGIPSSRDDADTGFKGYVRRVGG